MMKKKIISLLLALTLLLSAVPGAMAAGGSFTDIKDKNVAQAAETLRLLGVVDGKFEGKFVPDANLTRAEFCKMAIVMMGTEDQEPAYRSRTIFSDVTSTHWARGYINLAASGEGAFIAGMGNGRFAPDENITFAQAVTILVRLLGYTDADAGMQWPQGYLDLGAAIGLTEGLALGADAAITRGRAAELFTALLLCSPKAGGIYLARFGSVSESVIVLDNDAIAADGSSGAVHTSKGTFKTDVPLADAYVGERGTVVSSDGKLVVFIPTDDSRLVLSASTVEAGWFKDSEGKRYTVPAETVVYTESEVSTWSQVWLDMPEGSSLTLYFDAKGNIEAIFYATSDGDNVAVAMNEVKGNPFTSLLNIEGSYKIYKNGAPATAADIRRYDVAEYDEAAGMLRINDMRLSGSYENAYPSAASPEKVKLLGHVFEVLPSAHESLSQFKVGDMMTLLFTADMRVAGAVPTNAARSNALGIVRSQGSGSIEVELLSSRRGGLVLSGSTQGSNNLLVGELVTVSGSQNGRINVYATGGSEKSAKIDVAAMTYGTTPISPAVKIFDRVSGSMPVAVELKDLPAQIARGSVLYARTDYAGRVDLLVLEDVTGDAYTYGATTVSSMKDKDENGKDYTKYTMTISGKGGSKSYDTYPLNMVKHNSYGGVATTLDGQRVVAAVILNRLRDVSRTAFKTVGEDVTAIIDGVEYPVADNVQCYNAAAGEWFETLDDARRFASTLTVYYDRDPALGGKIRIVVAE